MLLSVIDSVILIGDSSRLSNWQGQLRSGKTRNRDSRAVAQSETLGRHVDITCGIEYDTAMTDLQIVIDTNVLVAALRSRLGASHRLLTLLGSDQFEVNVSVPLVFEYEDVLSRPEFGFLPEDIRDVVDYLCTISNRHHVYFLWRPYLNDPKDDMILELAVTAGCSYIVTFNERHFRGIEPFGLRAIRPTEFLRTIGDLP